MQSVNFENRIAAILHNDKQHGLKYSRELGGRWKQWVGDDKGEGES